MKYKYSFAFVDGKVLTFETTQNIDFHIIRNTAITFDDVYINMSNVEFIQKDIVD